MLLTGYLQGRGDALATFAAVIFVAYLVGRNHGLHVDRAEQAGLINRAFAKAGLTRRTEVAGYAARHGLSG